MPETYTDKFFENLHNAEFSRKDHYDGIDGLLLTTLSVLGGVGVYFAKLIPDALAVGGFVGWTFVSMSTVYGACVAMAAICIARSLSMLKKVAYPGEPQEMFNFVEALRTHLVVVDDKTETIEDAIEKDVLRVSRNHYARCASHNRFRNQEKTAWQARAKLATSIALVLTVVNAIPMLYIDHLHKEVQHVELEKWPATAPAELPKK